MAASGEGGTLGKGEMKPKSKNLKVIALALILVVVIAAILALALFVLPKGDDAGKPAAPGSEPASGAGQSIEEIGTPGAASAVLRDSATASFIDGAFETGDEMLYVFCEELNAGDNVAAMGDGAKYNVSGPVWFAYVDEVPGAFFEHDVRYIFIDASTGQKKIYEESWPPDINGEDMFDAAEGCGGVTEVYAT